ncbi:MAG: hypothetical protein KDA61_14070 [Planctomycetales bacterium]|nr:hypothetical protein [Planctomycetales bacterium]
MKRRLTSFFAALAIAYGVHDACRAVELYSENFDVDNTANWTINDSGTTDTLADFYYDYSAIGVPAAPGGVSTTGLKMTANNSVAAFGGFSVSPTGLNLTGDYRVEFKI